MGTIWADFKRSYWGGGIRPARAGVRMGSLRGGWRVEIPSVRQHEAWCRLNSQNSQHCGASVFDGRNVSLFLCFFFFFCKLSIKKKGVRNSAIVTLKVEPDEMFWEYLHQILKASHLKAAASLRTR